MWKFCKKAQFPHSFEKSGEITIFYTVRGSALVLKQACLPQILFGPFLNSMSQILFVLFPLGSSKDNTAWKVSTYGVISGPYFPVFGLNTGKYGPEITPYLDTFQAVQLKLYLISVCSKLICMHIYHIFPYVLFTVTILRHLFQKLPWNNNSI